MKSASPLKKFSIINYLFNKSKFANGKFYTFCKKFTLLRNCKSCKNFAKILLKLCTSKIIKEETKTDHLADKSIVWKGMKKL